MMWHASWYLPRLFDKIGRSVWVSCRGLSADVHKLAQEVSLDTRFQGIPDGFFTDEQYIVYWPRDSMSAKEPCLVGIQCACTSISCSAQSIAVLRSSCITSPLIEVFCTPWAITKLSKRYASGSPWRSRFIELLLGEMPSSPWNWCLSPASALKSEIRMPCLETTTQLQSNWSLVLRLLIQ